jgi:recombination protein RecA
MTSNLNKNTETPAKENTKSTGKTTENADIPKHENDNKERTRLIENAVSMIEKQFGAGSIMQLGSDHFVKVAVISTGSLGLDIATGIGGMPKGRIVEIFGHESSGKTTLALHVVANAQKGGGVAAYIDAEHAVDPGYARKIGVKTDELLISQPDCGEDALSIAETLVRSNAVDVIVIDSVAALTPKAELEGEMGDKFIGLQARMMSQAMRKLTATVAKSKTCLIFINQIREKVGVMFGNPETTTGGKALKFFASMRVEIRKQEVIKTGDEEASGHKVKAKVVKNKLAAPFRQAEFEINFNHGISKSGEIVDLGVDHKLIDKKGSWFSYGDEKIGQGRDAAKTYLEENHKLMHELEEKIKKTLLEKFKGK